MGDVASPAVSDVASPSTGPTALVSSQEIAHRQPMQRSLEPAARRSPTAPAAAAFAVVFTACCCVQAISVNRVKNMLKDDPEIKSISTEACFAVAKATELFVERLAAQAADRMAAAGRPDTLQYGDVAAVVAEEEPLDFLGEVVPQTVKAAALLGKM